MAESGGLVNLGELTKPATVLVEKVSDAIGCVFAPWQLVRMARAEAAAERIRAEARNDVADIESRALRRVVHEETQKQAHIERVTSLAVGELNEGALPEAIDADWLLNFLDKCRLTSDEDLQLLWGRILAGEANAPGKFSKRTVNLVASLDRTEAELFTAVCSLCWSFGEDDLVPLVFDTTEPLINELGINFSTIVHLDNIGLIRFQSLGVRQLALPKQAVLQYFGHGVQLTLAKDVANDLSIGKVILSRSGLELASIAGATPIPDYFAYVIERWRKEGLAPEIITAPTTAG